MMRTTVRKDQSQKQELAWVAKANTDSGQDRQQGLEGQRNLHTSHRVGESVHGMLLFQLLIPLQFLSLLRVMGTWIR